MSERGNKLNKILDKAIGIPLMPIAAIIRKIDKIILRNRKHSGVAIICFGAMGDLLICTSLINAIKDSLPNEKIDLYTSNSNKQIIPLIDGINVAYSFNVRDINSIIKSIRYKNYNILIDTTQWARISSLISSLSASKTTIGFKTKKQYRSMPYDIRVPHSNEIHEYKNFINLGKSILNIKNDYKPIVNYDNTIELKYIQMPYIVCHFYASGSNTIQREWGDNNWRTLFKHILQRNYNIYITGSKNDTNRINCFINDYFPNNRMVQNISGKLNFNELSYLYKNSKAVITINTGPMHLASILNTFVIALNGPTNPIRWGGTGENTINIKPKGSKRMLNLGFEHVDQESNSINISPEEVINILNNNGI